MKRVRTLVAFLALGLLLPAAGMAADGQPKKALTKQDQASASRRVKNVVLNSSGRIGNAYRTMR